MCVLNRCTVLNVNMLEFLKNNGALKIQGLLDVLATEIGLVKGSILHPVCNTRVVFIHTSLYALFWEILVLFVF